MKKIVVNLLEMCTTIAAIIALGTMYVSPPGIFVATPIDRTKLMVFVMGLSAIVYASVHWADRLTGERRSKQRQKLIVIVMVATIILQLICAFNAYDSIWGWDCQAVVLWNSGEWAEAEYFLRYPNNIMTAYILKGAEQIGAALGIVDVWLSAVLANILFVDLALIVMFCMAKDYFPKAAFLLTVFLGTSMIALTPQILIPYSDTIGMVFPILIIHIMLKIREEKNVVKLCAWACCLGIVTFLGYLIKPTALITWVACGICYVLFLAFTKKKTMSMVNLKRITAICIMTVIGILSVTALNAHAQDVILGGYNTPELKDQYEFPVAHFLMMGLKDEDGYYGSWNSEDYQATLEIPGKAEKTRHSLSVAKERIDEMGWKNLLIHLINKYMFVISDGTFYYGAEGDDWGQPQGNGLRYALQCFTHPDTVVYKEWYSQILHALWFIVLAGIAFFSAKQVSSGKMNHLGILLQMVAIGIIAFTLLSEGRSRYLYMFLPFFIMVAAMGFGSDVEKNTMKEG